MFLHLSVHREMYTPYADTTRADTPWAGCARFPEILQNFSEHQILWSLCSVVVHAFTLKLSIQTLLSVAPKLPVYAREKCEHYSKTSTPLTPP